MPISLAATIESLVYWFSFFYFRRFNVKCQADKFVSWSDWILSVQFMWEIVTINTEKGRQKM